jgi:polysaccharide export outer membrane protein
MKTSLILSSCLVALLAAAAAEAQGSRPPAPPPANPPSGSAPAATTPAPVIPPLSPPASARAATSNDYRLVTGDKLRIEVYKDPQLSQSLQIRPDGKITLPLIGDVAAAGKTSSELRDTLAGSLKEYIANPVVTVIVVETMPQTIHVMGEVNAPGPQSVTGDISIIQALASAGGFKLFANKKAIKVLRKSPTGVSTLTFNYNDAVKGRGKILALQPGDTVIVE